MGLEMIWVNKLTYSHENRTSRGETIASIDKKKQNVLTKVSQIFFLTYGQSYLSLF
jgi:hypothetical protein